MKSSVGAIKDQIKSVYNDHRLTSCADATIPFRHTHAGCNRDSAASTAIVIEAL